MDPDTRLMVKFKEGDRSAFEILFEKYHRPILNFCYRFLKDQFDAEEVAQETFIQMYRAAPDYQPLTKFSTWLYTIAKNICLNRLRKGRIDTLSDIEVMDNEGLLQQDKLGSSDPTPHQELEQKELAGIVKKAVEGLPESLRLPLILRRYQELSYEEIAQVVGISVTAVKLRLYRARRLLAEALAPYIKIE